MKQLTMYVSDDDLFTGTEKEVAVYEAEKYLDAILECSGKYCYGKIAIESAKDLIELLDGEVMNALNNYLDTIKMKD